MQDQAKATDKQGSNSPMRGFDAEFTDIVDYILRITYRIWEGKRPELCRRYYSDDCPVYTLAGYTEGAEEVTQNTIRTQTGFPDRTLHADNIVWGGNDRDGFHTSHLIRTNMTHLGPGEFGDPTNRHAEIQVIAHCIVRENRIVEEWLVRDNSSLCRQLGFDPGAYARKLATQGGELRPEFAAWLKREFGRVSSGQQPSDLHGDFSARGEALAIGLRRLWNDHALDLCSEIYATGATFHASSRPDAHGSDAISELYASLQAAMPDAKFSVDYLCENSMNPGDHVAIRWSLAGHHTGDALWGEPTGAPVLIIGESQYRLEKGKVVEEWLVFDELAVLTQIERAKSGG